MKIMLLMLVMLATIMPIIAMANTPTTGRYQPAYSSKFTKNPAKQAYWMRYQR